MTDSKCKKCRRAGEKLFLKGERCFTPKCAIVRKPYPPGKAGASRGKRRQRKSEFGAQLNEKQKVRFLYGVQEKQFSSLVEEAQRGKSGDVLASLASLLELRLDNVVFRLGFAISRSIARQIVSHGHIQVNGKQVTIPSYRVSIEDVIQLNSKALDTGVTKNLDTLLKKYEAPQWLELDKAKKIGKVKGVPLVDEQLSAHNMHAIIEYYSR